MKFTAFLFVFVSLGLITGYTQGATDSIGVTVGSDSSSTTSSVSVVPPPPAGMIVMSEIASRIGSGGGLIGGYTLNVGTPSVTRYFSHWESSVSGTVHPFVYRFASDGSIIGKIDYGSDFSVSGGASSDYNTRTGQTRSFSFGDWASTDGWRNAWMNIVTSDAGIDRRAGISRVTEFTGFSGSYYYDFSGEASGGFSGEFDPRANEGTLLEAESLPLYFLGIRTGAHKIAARLNFYRGYTLNALQYQIHLTAPRSAPVSWFEVFKPKNNGDEQYAFYMWTPAEGVLDSGLYTIDPIDSTRANRFPTQEGTYEVVLTEVGLLVDANRDGTITLASEDATDTTSADKPYRFWINDDIDKGDTDGSDIPIIGWGHELTIDK